VVSLCGPRPHPMTHVFTQLDWVRGLLGRCFIILISLSMEQSQRLADIKKKKPILFAYKRANILF
jgi:hypothetical protein